MNHEQRERLIDQGERADGRAGLPYVCHIRRAGITGADGQVCVAGGVTALACRAILVGFIISGHGTFFLKSDQRVRHKVCLMSDCDSTATITLMTFMCPQTLTLSLVILRIEIPIYI